MAVRHPERSPEFDWMFRYAGDESDVWREHPSSRFDWLLDRFRWFRRWRGGHWERWSMDFPVAGDIWFNPVQCCRRASDGRVARRPGLGFLPQRCEDYPHA